MEQANTAVGYVQKNSRIVSSIFFLIFAFAVLYIVYFYLYPADDPTYKMLLKGDADARIPVSTTGKIPSIQTGGDFTVSMWVYIDDWNYKTSQNKFLFSISPNVNPTNPNQVSPIVGILTSYSNGLMVRTSRVPQSPSSDPGSKASSSSNTPDITILQNMNALMTKQTSMDMFQTTVDTPCDIKEVPIQKWVCITIVSSGRVLDVYMDGKLSRSCVMDTPVYVESTKNPLFLVLGQYGGFSGRYSSVQMWNKQLTPDVIYGIYMMGPSQSKHNIFKDIAKYFNLNVTFTGSLPGQAVPNANNDTCSQNSMIMNQMMNQMVQQGSQGMGYAVGDITSGLASAQNSAYQFAMNL
jgi:hypothetical protein